MEKHFFTVILEREAEGGCHAFYPALKGCHTRAETLNQALDNIEEPIERAFGHTGARLTTNGEGEHCITALSLEEICAI